MRKPVIGIIGNQHLINDQYRVQAVGETNMRAVAEAMDAIPIMLPARPDLIAVGEAMEVCDGFLFPGGRPNVHPSHYGEEETEAHGPFDPDRDSVALSLIRAAVAAGRPILGVCRGFQELAVAFGGRLHPEIRDLPGRMNHRMPPDGTIEEKFALRHSVALTPGGVFARLFGADEIRVNTLHGQGLMNEPERIVIEGHADDGTPEAIRVRDAPGFALGVQWHAEWRAAEDAISRALFGAFAEAARGAMRRAA